MLIVSGTYHYWHHSSSDQWHNSPLKPSRKSQYQQHRTQPAIANTIFTYSKTPYCLQTTSWNDVILTIDISWTCHTITEIPIKLSWHHRRFACRYSNLDSAKVQQFGRSIDTFDDIGKFINYTIIKSTHRIGCQIPH